MQRLKAHLSRRASKRASQPVPLNNDLTPDEPFVPEDDSPQGNAARGVRLFCESAGPNHEEDEVLHLPVIVEAAESSPLAAREAALLIRRYLGKYNNQRPHVQYNAIMLIRILADNPGPTFTRSLDAKFTATVKDLLRISRDPSVQQILRETLENFATEKSADDGLKHLLEMWLKEKTKQPPMANDGMAESVAREFGIPAAHRPHNPHQQQNYFARNHRIKGLPSAAELASRIEEARTSAKLLLQVVQSTPSSEVLNNDLIAEFAQRCQSASRSIQGYINSDNPAPDDDTLLTLIETNEQLSTAMSKHQRAVLTARKASAARNGAGGGYQMSPSPGAADNGGANAVENPFGDENRSYHQGGPGGANSGFGLSYNNTRTTPTPPMNGAGGSSQPTASNSLFGPPSQPLDQPAPRDESFRLTLPHQPPESVSGTPAPPASDPRWSWSQRMSTQTGYGPPGAGTGQQGPAQGYQSQNSAQIYQRQPGAAEPAAMRGAPPMAQGGLGVPGQGQRGNGATIGEGETVSPVSPLDSRQQQGGMGRI